MGQPVFRRPPLAPVAPGSRGGDGNGLRAAGSWNAVRKRSRKVSIRQTGAPCSGCRPSLQPQPETWSSTLGSWATIAIGTSRLASTPTTVDTGWWSPRKTSTVFSSPYFVTKSMRLVSEYWMALPYSWRTRAASFQTSSRFLPSFWMAS